MDATEFHYLIYVCATPERVWRALTDPADTRRYWEHENRSDWRAGSRWEHVRCDPDGTLDIEGEVLAAEPGQRLEVTWVDPRGESAPGRVAIALAVPAGWPGGPWTEVRLAHTGLVPGSAMDESIRDGWPGVLSALKTLVECGDLAAKAPDASP